MLDRSLSAWRAFSSCSDLLVNIYAGEGGQDSQHFGRQLWLAYSRYAGILGLSHEVLYESQSSISVRITGKGAGVAFANEGGRHVVQRVPHSEANGRRHTSICSVAVMPFPEIPEFKLDANDVAIKAQRFGGKGGQNRNKVSNGVRAVHQPTGQLVTIDGRSLTQNKTRALEVLEQRISASLKAQIEKSINAERAKQLEGLGRSGKLRTYSFLSGKVTDHRSGKSASIDKVMRGELHLIL